MHGPNAMRVRLLLLKALSRRLGPESSADPNWVDALAVALPIEEDPQYAMIVSDD